MSKGVNKVIIIGNMGNDPDVRYTTTNKIVVNITVATTEKWKDKNTGESQEKTEWHRIVFFSPLAEIVENYLRKGSKIYIEGKLQTNKWQDKNGNDRYTTEIIAREMQMLGSSKSSAKTQAPASQQPAPAKETERDDFDDDIPF